jgi:hypothetical protein
MVAGWKTSSPTLPADMQHFTFGTRWGHGADAATANQIFDAFADAGGTFIDTAASDRRGPDHRSPQA